MIKKLKKTMNNNSGMTMLNVLVAFAVFLFIIAMFTQAVRLASNIYKTSEDVRKTTEGLYSDFYKNSSYSASDINATPPFGITKNSYTFKSDDGASSFKIQSAQGAFEDENGKVYFFGNRSEVQETDGEG